MAKKDRAWFIDNSASQPRMGIVEKATNAVTVDGHSSDYTAISEAKDITIYAIARDYDLLKDATGVSWSQIPIQFHEHIVSKAIASGYKDPRHMDLDIAQYFDNEFMMGIKKGKKFARSGYTTVGQIRQQDF
jgi:hypothetical protein